MSLPRVLLVHNAYRQAGGEDSVVAAERELLVQRGHSVIDMRRHNDEISTMGRGSLALQSLWSTPSHERIRGLLKEHRPDVVHVHNTFPLISPAIHWACEREEVPVVQTLHNFRLACPQAMFLRGDVVCEKCLGRTPWPAVIHGCYRGSRAQTAVVVGMLGLHRALGTYERKVARYIALSQFSRAKFVEAGIPAERISVKPNFADVPASQPASRNGLLFVGRLSPEKGIDVLARAWTHCEGARLRIVGTGPAGARLESLAGVEMLGQCSAAHVQHEMRGAVALVLPSICYENFPRTLVEAFGAGLPVIASRIGALAELVEDGRTGLLFDPGDANDLARALCWAHANPMRMAAMGANARARYESLYTPEINHRQLLAIYNEAIEEGAHA